MKPRYFIAAAALVAGAVALILIEPVVLGPLVGGRRGGWLSAVIQHGPFACACAALLCIAAGLGWLPRVRWPPITRERIRAFPTRGIPVADARAVAVFRIFFAAGVLVVLEVHRIEGNEVLQAITRVAVVLFGVGLLTPAALVVATIGVWWWMVIWTRHFGAHPISTIVIALPCLWPARWGDAWSLDALMWRGRASPPSIRYGYAIWMPRFVVGVALLAAAVAKFLMPEWIVNGTVKFAFVADYHRASVPWGLWIASHHGAAVAASAAAVIIEALTITAAFSRSLIYRLVVAALAMSLFVGFWLLQGERWLGWWLLIAAFLPWERLAPRAPVEAAARTGLTRLQWTAVAALVALQTVASIARLEIPPALSAYDMYSTTFDSTEAFDRANPMLEYRFEAETAAGTWANVSECFGRPASAEIAGRWGADTAALRESLATCDERIPAGLRRLRLFESLRVFDWEGGVFSWKYRDRQRWDVPI
jgi:hypothetical protein